MVSELPGIPHPGRSERKGFFKKRFGRIITEVTATDNSSLSILAGGRAVLDATKNLIQTATSHSYTQSYSIDADLAGVEVFQTFKDASATKPNVKFGLLVDKIIALRNLHGNAVFNVNPAASAQKEATFRALNDLNDNGHAQVVVTNDFDFWGFFTSNFVHRDHKKASTADGNRAIVSSANIGEHHLEWVDGGIAIQGPAAQVIEDDLAMTFAHARQLKDVYQTRNPWEYFKRRRGFPTKEDLLGSILRNPQNRGQKTIIHQPDGQDITVLTDSFWPLYQEATNEGFGMVARAQKGAKVDIFTPYPGIYSLTNQMIKAAKNGADVTLHIPKNDNYFLYNPSLLRRGVRLPVELQMKLWKKRMQKAGVHLMEFDGDDVSKGMIHLKAVRVQNPDNTGELLIGSMNLGKGLITHWNREMGVKVQDQKVLSEFDAFANQIVGQSTLVF